MNHMTWQPRLSTKRWQEAKTFALLHCGQITWNHIVFRINKTGQARINILTSTWTFLPFLDCTGTVQAVEQMSQLLWWPRGPGETLSHRHFDLLIDGLVGTVDPLENIDFHRHLPRFSFAS